MTKKISSLEKQYQKLLHDVQTKYLFIEKLRGIPGTIFFDLFSIFRSLSKPEEKQEAAQRLYEAYFSKPVAPQRWRAFRVQLNDELYRRAEGRHTTKIDELSKSALTGIFLAIHAINEIDVSALPIQDIYIPEWQGKIKIRAMLPKDRESLEKEFHESGRLPENFTAKVLVKSLVGKDGQRIFSDQDAPLLGKKSGVVLGRLFKLAISINEMVDKQETLQKEFLNKMQRELNEEVTGDLLHMTKKNFVEQLKTEMFDDNKEDDNSLNSFERIDFLPAEVETILDVFMRSSILSDSEHLIFQKRFIEDLTFAEVARELSIKENTAIKKFHRARQKLRENKDFKKFKPTL